MPKKLSTEQAIKKRLRKEAKLRSADRLSRMGATMAAFGLTGILCAAGWMILEMRSEFRFGIILDFLSRNTVPGAPWYYTQRTIQISTGLFLMAMVLNTISLLVRPKEKKAWEKELE